MRSNQHPQQLMPEDLVDADGVAGATDEGGEIHGVQLKPYFFTL